MIEFTCPDCGRSYSVPDAATGKKAKCKCGAALVVPAPHSVNASAAVPAVPIDSTIRPAENTEAASPPLGNQGEDAEAATPSPGIAGEARGEGSARSMPPQRVVPATHEATPSIERRLRETKTAAPPSRPAPTLSPPAPPTFPAAIPPVRPSGPIASLIAGKLPMRTRRLMADAAAMAKAFGSFDLIKLKATTGAPPEVYQIEYFIRGLERGSRREPAPREHHLVEIQLTSDYPRLGPKCRMLTPIFHPNIDPATICVGDHWTAGEQLADLVIRIGEMIAYQDYNIKSPLDAEAAMWADLNRDKLPIDTRNLYPPQLNG